MKLKDYLSRIGYTGATEPTLATLTEIHRQHLLTIPYENLDIQLGRPLDLDAGRIFNKLVDQGRGGWCYEMNGLLGWALSELGFDVTRANGGVSRHVRGDDALGNHLVLLVDLSGETWLADTGFGDGFIEPVPLREGRFQQRGFEYGLELLEDGYWRFSNQEHGGAPSFDFRAEEADEDLFRSKCEFLQTSPDSPFVLALIAQRFVEDGYQIQIGKHARTITPEGVSTIELQSAEAFSQRMADVFGIEDPGLVGLWPAICARHEEFFGERDAES